MTDGPIHRLRCACGWETRGTTDELVAATQEHGRRLHNMVPTRDEVLAMVIDDDADHQARPSATDGPAA